MATISFKANVGKIQGLKFSNDGKPRFQFSAAEGHRGKVDGEWQDTGTSWYTVTVFGYEAEDLAEVLQEGAKQRVSVSGRLASRDYEVNGEKRSSLDVVADHVGLVPPKATNNNSGGDWGGSNNSGGGQGWGGGADQSEAPF